MPDGKSGDEPPQSAGTGGAVTADGVETPTQLEFLRRLGCDVAQGYHFSRPLPAADCEAFVHARATSEA